VLGPARWPVRVLASHWDNFVGQTIFCNVGDEGKNLRVLVIAGAILLGALLIFIGAFGARWLAPAEGDEQAPITVTKTPLQLASSALVKRELDLDAMRELLAVLDPERRNQVIDYSEIFEKFVKQETLNQAVLAGAYANGAESNEAIRVLMERAGQRVLVEAYLNQVVSLNLDRSFPSDAQVREAYDKNPQLFRLPQRMHLWQIFIALDQKATPASSKAAWKLADQIVADLAGDKASFAALAKEHSDHEPSRVNDGYMGLIKTNELLAPISEAATNIKPNGVAGPIATESGLHIIKRGATVEEEPLAFETIANKIREQLKREAVIKVRQAAIEKISEKYPVAAPADDLEKWREALRAERNALGSGAAVDAAGS